MRRWTGLALLLALPLAIASACGGSDDDGSDASDAAASSSTAAASTGGAPLEVLGEQEICDTIPGDAVEEALGVEVTESAIGGSPTQQCAYNVRTSSGALSSVTIASMSSELDLGGRTGDDAFDHILELNRGLAEGADVDEAEVDAGDRAVRLTGPSLHLGIVAVDPYLMTVIVPPDVADAAEVGALMELIGDRLAS